MVSGCASTHAGHASETPVREIHTYDGDWFVQHNALRSPGAASVEDLRARQRKVEYYQATYAPMRRGVGVVPHPVYIDETNVEELRDFDFVFRCMDGRPGQEGVVRKLEELDLPFIDTGLGIEDSEDGLRGILRDHEHARALRSRLGHVPHPVRKR